MLSGETRRSNRSSASSHARTSWHASSGLKTTRSLARRQPSVRVKSPWTCRSRDSTHEPPVKHFSPWARAGPEKRQRQPVNCRDHQPRSARGCTCRSRRTSIRFESRCLDLGEPLLLAELVANLLDMRRVYRAGGSVRCARGCATTESVRVETTARHPEPRARKVFGASIASRDGGEGCGLGSPSFGVPNGTSRVA